MEVFNSFGFYFERIFEGAWLKAILATMTTIFLDYMHGDAHVLYIYMAFAFLDLFLGRKLAKKIGTYDRRKMKFWARKQLTQLGLVVIVAALGHSTFRTSGAIIPFINWCLLFMTYVEAASVEEKLKQLGLPIHPVIHMFFGIMRRKVAQDWSRVLDDPDAREQIEKALQARACKEEGGE